MAVLPEVITEGTAGDGVNDQHWVLRAGSLYGCLMLDAKRWIRSLYTNVS